MSKHRKKKHKDGQQVHDQCQCAVCHFTGYQQGASQFCHDPEWEYDRRELRRALEFKRELKMTAVNAAVYLLIGAAAAALWTGFKSESQAGGVATKKRGAVSYQIPPKPADPVVQMDGVAVRVQNLRCEKVR